MVDISIVNGIINQLITGGAPSCTHLGITFHDLYQLKILRFGGFFYEHDPHDTLGMVRV